MFRGSIVALVTPMAENGELDFAALDALVDWHVESGTDAIVAVGTTGESATLDEEEHCEVIRRVVQRAAGKIPVIAGTGANSTTEAIDLTRCAKEAGADACLLVTPYYNKPTQQGLYEHYKAIAEAVDIPQILYNVPGRTAVDMKPETVARLAKITNIIGIKEASGSLERVEALISACGPSFLVLSGDDDLSLDVMAAGGHGVISVTANVAPARMHQMCEAVLSGDITSAREINQGLMGLHKKLFLESNPIPVKWALCEMGRIPPGIRLPMTVLSEQHREAVREAMRQAGAL
ncbi:MAG: 4-hydroxy-tetrahydrodipicolinate synthase [Gammaproteobacteria bacterium]|nr:4-hydroxy-tetrahydrodipicolinate synthase [Gammaproteobacteria bacterium]